MERFIRQTLQSELKESLDEDMVAYIAGAVEELDDEEELQELLLAHVPALESIDATKRSSIVQSFLAAGKTGPPRTAESKPQATRLAGGTLRGKQGRTASGLTHRAVAAAARRGAGRGRGGGSPAPPSLPAALSAGASIVAPSTAPSSLSQAVAGGAADKSGGGTGQPSSAAAPPPSKPVQASPQLQQLCGMFPDVPSHLLARVLSRCLHNVTDCVELLLAQEDLQGYCRQVQEEADAAAARAVAAKQAQEEAARAANARVMERFHEVDPNASTATPDIIRTAQGGYMKIRVAKGQKLGKKALKRARKAALASAK